MDQGSHIPILANLTLDEIHHKLGNSSKQSNSINLDEWVKNFLSPHKEGQLIKNPSSSSSSSSSSVFRGNFNPNGTLSGKTADEVCREIIPEESVMNPRAVVASGEADWLKFPVELNFQVSEMGIGNPVVEFGESQAGFENKCLFKDEVLVKTIERRQKRMMRNRESAARSRARKQAHTNQLEHKVILLRRTNNWLKKKKEMDVILSSTSKLRFQLQRTSSSLF